jgi:hypothetical protein
MQTDQIEPQRLRVFHHPPGTVRVTVNDERSYWDVKVFQAWPLSEPGKHVSFQDGKGDEILMLEDLSGLDPASREVTEEELRRRYLTARVEAVRHIRTEFGVTYWHVGTDRGERDFVVQSLSESCVWLSPKHVLIVDVDGNRFEIPDFNALDAPSRQHLETVF